MSILIFIIVLVVLILVHEWGHFIVAKKSGIRVDEFGIGFPPKVWGKKIGETEYTLNWLPLGGFVRIWGEDPTQEHFEQGVDNERSFVKKPRYIQALVLVAGVAMNVLLAYVLFVVAFMMGSPTAVDEGASHEGVENVRLLVTSVLPESPAAEVLKPGDHIVALQRGEETLKHDGNELTPSQVASFVARAPNVPVSIALTQDNEVRTVEVIPVAGLVSEEPDRVLAGFTMSLVGTERHTFFEALGIAGVRTWQGLVDITVGLGSLLVQSVQGEADLSQVTGPVGIVGLVGDAADLGFVWLLTFTAFISLNLAVINLLPIPALDGGRLVFVAIEAITRKAIKPIIATRVNQIGFVALLALMALVTVSDVMKLF